MPLPIACPAAVEVHPPDSVPSVRCGVLALSNEGAHAGGFQSRGQVDPVFDGARDVNTVRYFCCHDGAGSTRKGYPRCTIWQAQREAEAAARRGPDALRDEEAVRVDAAPDPRVKGALDALEGGSFSEAGAMERALNAGGVVLGGG